MANSKGQTKQDALEALDTKLKNAQTVLNNCTTPACRKDVTKCIEKIGDCMTDIRDAAWVAAASDPDFAKAIKTIQGETKKMNDVAPNMGSATDFINSLTGFLTAAGKIAPAIKGLG